MPAGSSATITFLDFTSEKSQHNVPSYQIDAANLATWLTGWGDYKTALGNITIGTQQKEIVRIYDTDLSNTPPTDPYAQRELKLLIRYSGGVGQNYQLTIPCPDLSALTFASGALGNSDFIELADGGVIAVWVAAFEAIARSPEDDTVTVTVDSAQVIGRNV